MLVMSNDINQDNLQIVLSIKIYIILSLRPPNANRIDE